MLENSLSLLAYLCIFPIAVSLSVSLPSAWWYVRDSGRHLSIRRDSLRSRGIIWYCFWCQKMRHGIFLLHDLRHGKYRWMSFLILDSLSRLRVHSSVRNVRWSARDSLYLSWNDRWAMENMHSKNRDRIRCCVLWWWYFLRKNALSLFLPVLCSVRFLDRLLTSL